ncbi:type II toxin-antitoxin system death-on-curing family toxin [Parashewanella curva]|uniref:Type II toxin-antitoxin system death-on-curing family toxin n=1 Tax=Parashewanella curva TaxID=2338552 RepID=A0A3L8PRR7_9GAMM|nr:type II toxin-antitoxin system death-on-curing family toxin [Parashewanella curva]RLV58107.1 type II toxin-antitoxin system death-on-curing family toxin [Parashewanella curva]
MDIQILYFDVKHAVKVHDWIIDHSGGLTGTKNIGQLESVLEHIQNDLYYPNLEEKLNHLVFSINKFHAFNDGNKRSSLVLGAYFLELNGYDYCVKKFVHEMENIVVWVAENKIDKELLKEIITSIIMEDDFSESLKLKIIHSVNK